LEPGPVKSAGPAGRECYTRSRSETLKNDVKPAWTPSPVS